MQTIRVTDDLSAERWTDGSPARVVRMKCDCGNWEDKTYFRGCLPYAHSHLERHHGGTGKVMYKGHIISERHNGVPQEIPIHNYD